MAAEPARNLPEIDKPNIRPNLGLIQGGGETSSPTGKLSGIAGGGGEALDAPKLRALEGGGETTPRTGKLKAVAGGDNETGGLYSGLAGGAATEALSLYNVGANGAVTKGLAGKVFKKGVNKNQMVGGGVAAGVAGIGVALLLAAVPLKIEHMVNNIRNHFFSAASSATEKETQNMLSEYLQKYALPGYGKCGTTISKECSPVSVTGSDPVSRMYKTWANQKLENKLATNKGIEFQRRADGHWYIKAPGSAAGGDDIGTKGEKLPSEFKRADRAAMRAAVTQATEGETLAAKIILHYQISSLLAEKYGVRRCLMFCGVSDPLADSIKDQKVAFKLFLNQRVIIPHNETLGLAIKCLLEPNCDPTVKDSTSPSLEENGAPKSEFDITQEQTLASLAAETEGVDLAALEKTAADIEKEGFEKYLTKYLIRVAFGEVADSAAVDTALDKVPYIGWINLGTQVINGANGAGPKLKAISYVKNTETAIKLAEMFTTYADEIHTGHVTATEVGSVVKALGPGIADASSPLVGGTATAEETPLYAQLMDDTAEPTATGPGSPDYVCANNKPVPQGQVVCDEEIPGVGVGIATDIHEFLNQPGVNILTGFSLLWGKTVGELFNVVGLLLEPLIKLSSAINNYACGIPGVGQVVGDVISGPITGFPGYCSAQIGIKAAGPAIIKGIEQWVIPNPFGDNMSGGRNLDMLAMGVDAESNDFAHIKQGGQLLTNEQVNAIRAEQTENQRLLTEQTPMFARLFDTSSPTSLVSKMAMAIPINLASSVQSSFASLIANPFKAVSSVFGSMISSRVGAKAAAAPDAFEIPQYGYPDGTIPDNPQEYYQKNCNDSTSPDEVGAQTKAWNDAAANTIDDHGQATNTTVNPCLLTASTAGANGARYDSSLLTTDEQKLLGN